MVPAARRGWYKGGGMSAALAWSEPALTAAPAGPLAWRQQGVWARTRTRPSNAVIALVVLFTVGIALILLRYLGPLLVTDSSANDPVTIARVALVPVGEGIAVDVVLLDRQGRDTGLDGDLTVDVKQADGSEFHTTRAVTAAGFVPIPGPGPLAGRRGIRTVIPSAAWPRPPRRGTQASITVTAAPRNAALFSAQASDVFP